MRPYLAIVVDSFREAIASRTLWLLLALITLALLVVFPLTYRETRTTDLQLRDVNNWDALAGALKSGQDESKATPAKHLWTLYSDPVKQRIANFKPLPKNPSPSDRMEYDQAVHQLRDDLNELFANPKFVHDRSWSGLDIPDEGRELRRQLRKSEESQTPLSSEEQKRLSRIYFEAGFPGIVNASEPTSFQMVYALYGDFGDPVSISKSMFHEAIMAVLPWFIDKFVLSIGLLVAILVTASIIPQTFEPGSLHLLLSKPLTRSLIYTTKFFGGCAFVLLSATYLFVGLWLFFGLRLSLWEARLLWCIPIYGFVFAVYYSVAAFAGVLWRNTVVSIMVAILFWGTCYLVGMGKQLMEGSVTKAKLTTVQDSPIGAIAQDGANQTLLWDAESKSWQVAFLTKELMQNRAVITAVGKMPDSVGPIYSPTFDQMLGARLSFRNGQVLMNAATKSGKWRANEFTAPPSDPQAIFLGPNNSTILVTSDGVYQVEKKLEEQPNTPKIFGMTLALPGSGMRRLGPDNSASFSAASVSYTPAGDLWIYSRGKIWQGTFVTPETKPGGKPKPFRLKELASKTLFEKDRQRGKIAATSKAVVIGREDGSVTVFDAQTLDPLCDFPLRRDAKPQAISADEGLQQFFILASDGYLWTYDHAKQSVAATSVQGQGDISGISPVIDGKLMVIDRSNRVTTYDVNQWKSMQQIAGPSSLYTLVYEKMIQPFYTVFPKPGEMYKPITELLTPPKTTKPEAGRQRRGLQRLISSTRSGDPWQPIWSSGLFLVIMVVAGCVYMEMQEF
ncbi:MAG: ABC transporter permease [Planctomycetaceae bacterium]